LFVLLMTVAAVWTCAKLRQHPGLLIKAGAVSLVVAAAATGVAVTLGNLLALLLGGCAAGFGVLLLGFGVLSSLFA